MPVLRTGSFGELPERSSVLTRTLKVVTAVALAAAGGLAGAVPAAAACAYEVLVSSLRVRASDAAGAPVAETITRAYQLSQADHGGGAGLP